MAGGASQEQCRRGSTRRPRLQLLIDRAVTGSVCLRLGERKTETPIKTRLFVRSRRIGFSRGFICISHQQSVSFSRDGSFLHAVRKMASKKWPSTNDNEGRPHFFRGRRGREEVASTGERGHSPSHSHGHSISQGGLPRDAARDAGAGLPQPPLPRKPKLQEGHLAFLCVEASECIDTCTM